MTRTTDVFVPLAARAAYANANGAHRFVSLHCNSAKTVQTGIETFCFKGAAPSDPAYKLAAAIQSEMIAAWPLADRGVKTASFVVLENTNMPAALSEMGFMNNCANDATYQASAAHRETAAKAHLFALQKHLGLPVVDPTLGTVQGVVFEDQGTPDTSIRLPGAKVSVISKNITTFAAAPDAAWSFKLPAGSRPIEASHPGYQGNQRTCNVVAGKSVWCSIGLKPVPQPKDSGVVADTKPPPDSGPPLDSASTPDTSPVEDTSSDFGRVATLVWPDAGAPDLALTSDSTAPDSSATDSSGVRPPAEQEGCSVGGAPGSLALPVVLLLLGLALRRRTLVVTLALCTAASGCADGPFARLHAEKEVADGIAPVISPDGARVAFTRPGLDRLAVQTLDSPAPPRVVSARRRAGYRPVWRADGAAIGLRPADEPHGLEALEAVDLDGRVSSFRRRRERAAQKDDCIYLVSPRRSRVVACGGDRYFAPERSADGRHVVYCGLSSGLHVHRTGDRRTIPLGPGHQPALSGDGRWLVFMRSRDDGERLTHADLWITDLADPGYRTARLARTPHRLEQHPSLSRDGKAIAFSAGGRIYVARLEVSK
jgi:N-acetylmuramoyl-L-alanine amidase